MAAVVLDLAGSASAFGLRAAPSSSTRCFLSNPCCVHSAQPLRILRKGIRCDGSKGNPEQTKKDLEDIANKVSAKAEEISKDFAKSTNDIKQAASSPEVPPQVESAGLGPEKIPSGPYSFREVFSFNGLAPEITNGRIAMLSYLSVITLEYVTGKGIVEQLSTGGWLPAVAISSFLGIASVVPLFKGYRNDDWPGIGPFNARAERWNSRAGKTAKPSC